jgi:hypothetical protein
MVQEPVQECRRYTAGLNQVMNGDWVEQAGLVTGQSKTNLLHIA